MTETQTPQSFAEACNHAADQLMITTAEANAAIAKFTDEYEAKQNRDNK